MKLVSAVEINVGADTLVDPGFLGNDLRCDPLDHGIQGEILVSALGYRQF